MPITARQRLASARRRRGAGRVQLSVPAVDVRLSVTGAGPIKAPQAKQMIAVAQPARFRRGEQTLTDLSVRDACSGARLRPAKTRHPVSPGWPNAPSSNRPARIMRQPG